MVRCIPDMVEKGGTARLFPFGVSRPALGTSVDCSKTRSQGAVPFVMPRSAWLDKLIVE
jgi:hypothetical protein